MLKNIIENRYSARNFDNIPIKEEKIQYILECALDAPSKQSLYPYKIFVLGNSKKATKFKNWLFWHDTWCADGVRADKENKTPKNTRYNGQYNAPLLFLYTYRELNDLKYIPGDLRDNNRDPRQNLIDMTVSASFAMLAAEEQGLRTCFGNCHNYEYIDTVLGAGSIKIDLALGIGYASSVPNHRRMLNPINKKKKLQGYDTNNLEQSYPIEMHNVRQNKSAVDKLFKFI